MTPKALLQTAGDTLGEMQSRVNKTRQVGIVLGAVVTAVGLGWTLWAVVQKPKEVAPQPQQGSPIGTKIP